ncbi:MAG: hypothetical protein ACXACF_08375, partial [Candidatus Hermodarchaeia archaeon]
KSGHKKWPLPHRGDKEEQRLNPNGNIIIDLWLARSRKKPLWCGGRGKSEISHRGLLTKLFCVYEAS